MSKISIIMPVYNNISYIKKAIKSVLNQNFKFWELIISDDVSTDGTRDFLQKIKNKKIKIFYQKKNLGIFNNLKFLHQEAKYPIIKIFCADDILKKNCLSLIYEVMNNNLNCKLLSGFQQNRKNDLTYKFLFNQKYNSEFNNKKNFYYLKKNAAMFTFFAFGNICGNLSQVAYKKEINNRPVFNQKYPFAGDYNAWVRFSKKNGLFILKKEIVYVRAHKKQASYLLNLDNSLYDQLNKIYKYLLNNINKDYHELLRQNILRYDLPARLTRYFENIISCKFNLSKKIYSNLPLNISFFECFIYIFHYKFFKYKFNETTKKILLIIKKLNN